MLAPSLEPLQFGERRNVMKILMVDDQIFWHEQLCRGLAGKPVEIISALNLAEAYRLFILNYNLDAVVVDDCLSEGMADAVDTLDFVAEVRRGFSGIMLACCSDCNHGAMLVSAGCNEQVLKSRLIEKLLDLCGLSAVAAVDD